MLLANNTVRRAGLLAEHGLSFWIEHGESRLLFDTGQGLVLHHNAAAMGLDLHTVTDVVLSHGHYDHTGGLGQLAQFAGGQPRLWMHPSAMRTRFSRHHDGSIHDIGMPASSRESLDRFRLRNTDSGGKAVDILPGIFATGPIQRTQTGETIDGFFLDPEGQQPDDISDDQALWFDTDSGVVALLGCAHAGCINTLEQIHVQSGGRPLAAVIGGTHLGSADSARLACAIDALRRFAPRWLIPLHCTGDALPILKNEFPSSCVLWGVGDGMTFSIKPL